MDLVIIFLRLRPDSGKHHINKKSTPVVFRATVDQISVSENVIVQNATSLRQTHFCIECDVTCESLRNNREHLKSS